VSSPEFLLRLTRLLEESGMPYMIAGSVASSFYGEPRATNDVDLVIAPDAAQLEVLLDALGRIWYVSPEAAREAWRERSAFNVIDFATGEKADLIVRRERPYSREEFARRRRVRLGEAEFFLVSPEDAILSKLEWARAGGSERQFRDALGVAAAQGPLLDRQYLLRWAKELGLAERVAELLAQAEGMQR